MLGHARPFFFAAAMLVSWSHAQTASAQSHDPKERAAQLLQEGVQRRAEGKDEAALLLFRQADELDSTPKSRAQLALSEQSLGMWVIAEKHLRDALAQASDPWIEKNRALLESSLTRIAAELGWIDITGAPARAEIFIDGARLGETPLEAPMRAAAGVRLLEMRAAGYEPYSRRILVRGGEISRERASFVKARAVEAARTGAGGDPKYVDVTTPSPLRTVGWIGFGVGAAAAIFGGTSFIVRQNYVDAYNSDERCPGTASPSQPPSCQSQKDGVSRWSTLGVASLIGGGVLMAGGLALVLTAKPTHHKVPVASVAARCGLTLGGVSCGGVFQ